MDPTCNSTASDAHQPSEASMHLQNTLVCLALLGGIDKLLLTPFLQRRCTGKDVGITRWFFLHSIANAAVCATALVSMRAVLIDPLHALDGRVYTDTSMFGDERHPRLCKSAGRTHSNNYSPPTAECEATPRVPLGRRRACGR